MSLTLAEAAARTGLDKSTIRRAVRSGRISGTRDDLGVWHVEPVELFRVFEPVRSPTDAADALPRDGIGNAPDAADKRTDELVAALNRTIEDLTRQRDSWQRIAEARLLPATQPQPVGWWRWLRSSG